MTPIRLLFVLTSPTRGGVEEVVLALLRRLDPGQFTLALAAPGPLLDALEPDLRGRPVARLAVAAGSWLAAPAVRRLSAFMGRFRPHVVNPHLFRSTAVAAPLARWHRVPAVVETYHGREAWRRGPLRGSFWPDRVIAARCVDRTIAVSAAARDFLVRVKRYAPDRVVVVPNGRDLSAFVPGRDREAARKELGLDPRAPVAGVVGRLDPQKGHRHLLDAWPAVVRALPDARLVVVGDGVLRPALEEQARGRGVGGSVMFTGFRRDVARLLAAMDVATLPSLHEGMPLTVIEAAAMALPVVATAVDGTPEVIEDGVSGLLVPAAHPAALARALLALLGDPDRARRMGRAGRQRMLDRFDLGRQVAATAAVYRAAVAGRR